MPLPDLGHNTPARIPEITKEMRCSKREQRIEHLLQNIEFIKKKIPPPKEEYRDIYIAACRITTLVRILMGKDGKKHFDIIMKLLSHVYSVYLFIFFEGNIDFSI